MNPTIQLLDGSEADLFNPRPEWFEIRSVAHSLADKNRFCGQAKVFGYSVAEHCVRMSRLFEDPTIALYALLHELDEVLLPEMPGPLKHAPEFVWYRSLCEKHMKAGHDWFGLAYPRTEAITLLIKSADEVMLVTEKRDLTANAPWWNRDVVPLAERIVPVGAAVAAQDFLARFGHLLARHLEWVKAS